jgi:hypothetical protein
MTRTAIDEQPTGSAGLSGTIRADGVSGYATESPRLLDRPARKRLRARRVGNWHQHSGPNCLSDCITYPYTDVAAFVPGDYLWM